MYTPFDFNEAIAQRKDYIDVRLREGSPVVGAAFNGGVLLLTVRRSQRKVYEVYDRQMFSAIGNQSDIENVRLASIQMTHQEGFDRSPEDVSIHRLVGFSLSPALKKAFGDQLAVPFVVRALFAEVGRTPAGDCFMTLNFDGEFRKHTAYAVIAGTQQAEDEMLETLTGASAEDDLDSVLARSLKAWSVGARAAMRPGVPSADEDEGPLQEATGDDADRVFLADELRSASIEAGILERRANRDSHFRLIEPERLARITEQAC